MDNPYEFPGISVKQGSMALLSAVTITGNIVITQATAPATPPANTFYIYVDSADTKLKCKGPSGTVTILGIA